MFIHRNLSFFRLDTVRLPKCLAIVSINFVLNYSSTCDTLLLSTYHDIVHWLLLMALFAMYLSYGLIRKPCYFRVFEYRSYNSSSGSMNPDRDFRRLIYSNFNPLSTCTFFFSSGFTSNRMSKNAPSIFNRINISYVVSVLRYAPRT